jgi:Ran GTPase-activating protein (RanGAP) involved in mRNA processing and transport
VLALAADLAAHTSLTGICFELAPLNVPAALDAVVDAALACRLSFVELHDCGLSPASAPALVRLLRGDTLAELNIDIEFEQLLDAPAATLLANTLRANTSLTSLTLTAIQLWHDAAAAAELVGTLTAHPRLRVLDLSDNQPHAAGMQAAEAGAALAALVLANAPALQTLHIRWCHLGDEGMGPVVEALRHNTHLTKLDCSGNELSEPFARDVLLPAVRANTSLRELVASEDDDASAAREAVALVVARTRTTHQPD